MDWASIFITFNSTDISYNKFKGKYKEDFYEDQTTGLRGLSYSALEPDLLTRFLQVSLDPFNNRITSIYIETAKHDFWGSKTQKLLYVPLRVIQIQEKQTHRIGKSGNMRVDYRFMQEEEVVEY
jgi:hypothetical protein